jgi:hypothetical protein
MHEIDNITSILNAVNEINLKTKKKTSNILVQKNFIPKLNKDTQIPFDLVNIIKEAEEYRKKSSLKSSQVDLIQKKNFIKKTINLDKTFEDVQSQIIDDLYSKFTKKIKKNTLKIIFDLHLKIKNLEKQLENFKTKNYEPLNINKSILKDVDVELQKKPDQSIVNLDKTLSKNKNLLKDEVVKSLKIQDSTINILNEKIKNYKNVEEKLRSQLIDIEQDKFLLLKKAEKFEKSNDYKNILNETKETLKSIYNQVKKQKLFFLDLKNNSIKMEIDFNFYKENYEKLIIENNDIKKRLSNTNQQVEAFESIKKELAFIFENFNNVLTKNSIIKLNESFSKISSVPVISDSVNKK